MGEAFEFAVVLGGGDGPIMAMSAPGFEWQNPSSLRVAVSSLRVALPTQGLLVVEV